MAEPSATLASHPPGETPKSANERHLLQNMSLNRVEDFSIADVGSWDKGQRLLFFPRVMPHTLPKRARSVRPSKVVPKPFSKKLFQHPSKAKLKTAAKSLT